MLPLLPSALLALGALTLIDLPAPRGGARAARVCDAAGARTVWVSASGDTLASLGADFIPVAWTPDGAAVRGYRLVDDGHDLLAAHPEERRPGAPPTAWAAPAAGFDTHLARLAAAVRPAAPASAPQPICVDAGHGGPGAAQWNGINGDGAGSHGPTGLTEQWVNLRVSHFLMQHLAGDPRFAGSFRTRTAETQGVTLADRVLVAAQGGATLFLSIHHNGLPAGTPNRTETYYCRNNPGCTDVSAWSRPARLFHDRVVAAFGYPGRGALEDSSGSGRFHFYVLRNSPCISALCESSNLNADAQEEDLFGRDPAEAHARAEALALYQGLLEWFGYPTAVGEPVGPTPEAAVALGPPMRSGDGTGLRFEWRVDTATRVEAVLIDVRGRRVRSLGPLAGPGQGTLEVARTDGGPGGALAPGVYWLTLTEGGTIRARRRLIPTR